MKPAQLIRHATLALASTLALGLLTATPVEAAAPMVKTSAPGYYRVMLGDFEVTALNDGVLQLPLDKILDGVSASDLDKALALRHQSNPVTTSINGYLINTGEKLVLVDTGTGGAYGPTNGKLIANLKAAGYQPEQVDEIYITHFHGDHIGGLSTNGVANFPNAVVRADKAESDYWLSQTNMDKAPDSDKGGFKGAMAALQPYVAAGHFKPFEGNVELVPGIHAVNAHGHTPGHANYLVESKGKKLILWGDLMHAAAVQFANPSITIKFDSDSKAARAARKAAYKTAAKEGYLIGSAHLSFPGLGYLRSEGAGYVWIPVNYELLQ